MSFLCKIGIHDYRKKGTAIVTREKRTFYFSGRSSSFTLEGLMTLYKCDRCGKEKASVHLEDNTNHDIPVWKAHRILKGE